MTRLFEQADLAAAQRLQQDAEAAQGPLYALRAAQARQRFIAAALGCEGSRARLPSSTQAREAITGYLEVLRAVYGSLVLEPHVLQATALQGEPARWCGASRHCACARARARACARHLKAAAHSEPGADEGLHQFRMCQRRFIVYQSPSPCTAAGKRVAACLLHLLSRLSHLTATTTQATRGTQPCRACGSTSRIIWPASSRACCAARCPSRTTPRSSPATCG